MKAHAISGDCTFQEESQSIIVIELLKYKESRGVGLWSPVWIQARAIPPTCVRGARDFVTSMASVLIGKGLLEPSPKMGRFIFGGYDWVAVFQAHCHRLGKHFNQAGSSSLTFICGLSSSLISLTP